MNPPEILKLIDQIHEERGLAKETIFQAMEQALAPALRRQQGGMDDSEVRVYIDRKTGAISALRDNIPVSPGELSERIGVQTSRQILMQKLRDAERDMIYDTFAPLVGQLVHGTVHRVGGRNNAPNGGPRRNGGRGGVITVRLGDTEAILPHSEMVIGEVFHPDDPICALVREVTKVGSKVKIVLSRKHKDIVRRLLEQESPEINDGVVEIKAISRDPHRRSKIAVTTSDPNIDLIGACVGTRGARSRAVTDALQGERIDIVVWRENKEEFIRNALRPATIDAVFLCPAVGRAIVVIQPDQRKPAIGARGQNVRLASHLCEIDLDVMTQDELDEQLHRAEADFCTIEGMSSELAQYLVGAGYLSYYDLSVIEIEDLMSLGNLSREEAERIVDIADARAEELERMQESGRPSQL